MLALCKVTDSLFISNSRSACNENLLAQERISFCINVSRQQPFPSSQQIQTLRVPVFDDPSEDLYRYFECCSDAIEGTVQSGGKCLVYCKNGRSRSAAICTAYLMRHQNLSLKDAFEVDDSWLSRCLWSITPINPHHCLCCTQLAEIASQKCLEVTQLCNIVKTARPVADPNPGFWSQLQKYEKHLQTKPPSQKGTLQYL